MGVKQGWTGRVFEDFEVGDVYEHPLGRTVLAADNAWFTLLTLNTNPVHFDAAFAARTEFGKPLVNSCLTLAIVTGQSVSDLSQNAMANLGWDEVRMPHPVFEGDTIYASSEVLEIRESKSRPNVGIVREDHGFNQTGRSCSSSNGRSWSTTRPRPASLRPPVRSQKPSADRRPRRQRPCGAYTTAAISFRGGDRCHRGLDVMAFVA